MKMDEIEEANKAEMIDKKYKEYGHFSHRIVESEKLRTSLKGLIPLKASEEDEEIETKGDYVACMDDANVCMVISKSPEMNLSLSQFKETLKPVDLKYKAKSKYSLGYLKKMINIFEKFNDDSVTIEMSNDNPIQMSNSFMSIILAPRIENE